MAIRALKNFKMSTYAIDTCPFYLPLKSAFCFVLHLLFISLFFIMPAGQRVLFVIP